MMSVCRALWHDPCPSPMAVQRKNAGDRQANMTALVVEVLEAKAQAMRHDPVFASGEGSCGPMAGRGSGW